jgi:hypothetical protein
VNVTMRDNSAVTHGGALQVEEAIQVKRAPRTICLLYIYTVGGDSFHGHGSFLADRGAENH